MMEKSELGGEWIAGDVSNSKAKDLCLLMLARAQQAFILLKGLVERGGKSMESRVRGILVQEIEVTTSPETLKTLISRANELTTKNLEDWATLIVSVAGGVRKPGSNTLEANHRLALKEEQKGKMKGRESKR